MIIIKTWEMVKELTENLTKKFKTDVAIAEIGCDNEIHFYYKVTKKTYFPNIDDEWEEIKQPVSFVEAVKAFADGKDIYCEYNNTIRNYVNMPFKELLDDTNNPVSSFEILNGKWYIA